MLYGYMVKLIKPLLNRNKFFNSLTDAFYNLVSIETQFVKFASTLNKSHRCRFQNPNPLPVPQYLDIYILDIVFFQWFYMFIYVSEELEVWQIFVKRYLKSQLNLENIIGIMLIDMRSE